MDTAWSSNMHTVTSLLQSVIQTGKKQKTDKHLGQSNQLNLVVYATWIKNCRQNF